jgi:hypothetical protein
MKTNQKINNFYTPEELLQLETYVESVVHKSNLFSIEKNLGRYYGVIQDKLMSNYAIGNFPNNLLYKVQKFAEDIFKVDNLQIFDIIIIRYTNEYGLVPKLHMHKDGGSLTKYTVDYQYKSNTDWAITVEDQDFYLKDNQALTFLGSKQLHGRPEKIFNNGEYVENIFFQFIEKRN